jgi:hypothetical protein
MSEQKLKEVLRLINDDSTISTKYNDLPDSSDDVPSDIKDILRKVSYRRTHKSGQLVDAKLGELADGSWSEFRSSLEQSAVNLPFTVLSGEPTSGSAGIIVARDLSSQDDEEPASKQIIFKQDMELDGENTTVPLSTEERCPCPNVAILNASGCYVITRCPHKARYSITNASVSSSQLWTETKIDAKDVPTETKAANLGVEFMRTGKVCRLHKSSSRVLIDWEKISPAKCAAAEDNVSLIQKFTRTVDAVDTNVNGLIEKYAAVNEENEELAESVNRYATLLKKATENARENALLAARSMRRLDEISTKAKEA